MNEIKSEINNDELKKKAVKGAGVNVLTSLINLIFNTTGLIVLGRILTPRDFGLVSMVTAFSMWFMNFGFNGFTEYIIQRKTITNEELNSIFWIQFFISSTLTIFFIFFGFFLVHFYGEPSLFAIAAVMSTSIVLMGLCTTHMALLNREMKFSSIAIISLVTVIFSVLLSIAAAELGMSYWAVVIRQLTFPIVSLAGAWVVCKWRPRIPRKISDAFNSLKYAIQVYGNFTIGYMIRNIDKVLLGKFHGSETLGNYDRSYYLSMMPVTQLLTPISSVAQVTLSRLRDDEKQFLSYYQKAVSMVSFLGTAGALILTLSAKDIMILLLGQKWAAAGPVVMAFGPGIAAMLIYGTHSWLHLSLGTANRWLKWNIFASIITIGSFFIAAPYGGVALAAAYSSSAYILILPGLWYAGRPVNLKISSVVSVVIPYFLAGILTALVWYLIPQYFTSISVALKKLSYLCRVIVTFILSPLFYIFFIILIQRNFQSIREVKDLIRVFISR